MKRKWISRLGDINKELLLILSIIAAAGVVNFFIAGQRLVLTFYNLPTLMAAYYFGRRRAVEAAVASILFVVWMNLMNPTALGGNLEWKTQGLLAWSDLCVWAGFLLISAYATGSLYELGERRLRRIAGDVLRRAANSESVHRERQVHAEPFLPGVRLRNVHCRGDAPAGSSKSRMCARRPCCTILGNSKSAAKSFTKPRGSTTTKRRR